MAYKITSDFQYIYHFASTKEIADTVVNDISSIDECQYADSIAIEECKETWWDPGSSLWVGDDRHVFKLNDIDIKVYIQHINIFAEWVYKTELRTFNGVDYYKIHSGYMACVCITPTEYEKLKAQLSDPELGFKATNAFEERCRRVEASGIIQCARITDEDGNKKIVRIKPKDPILN